MIILTKSCFIAICTTGGFIGAFATILTDTGIEFLPRTDSSILPLS
jgi:hypothetical protein